MTIILQDTGKRFNRDWIFRSFSYQFKAGTTYAITGPNGSGKSTLLSVLSGHVDETEKSVSADDVYKHVAIAAPYLDLIDEFTIAEHVAFHFTMKSLRNDLTAESLIGFVAGVNGRK